MRIARTYPDPATGQSQELWAIWILSEGTTPGGLLEKMLLYDGAASTTRVAQEYLDPATIPHALTIGLENVHRSWKTAVKLNGRNKWVMAFGKPKYRGQPYFGPEIVYLWRG